MLKKVYLAKNQEDAQEEAKADYGKLRIISCIDLKFEEFCRLHQPSIFRSNEIICFNSVDEYNVSDLLDLYELISQDVVWCFSSLAKNTKLYKKLKLNIPIEEVGGLEKQSDKKQFICNILNKNHLPSMLEDSLSLLLPSDRAIIKMEIEKAAALVSLGFKTVDIPKYVCSYNCDLDALLFIQAFLTTNIKKAYTLALKLEGEVSALQIHTLILKKLKSLIFLSSGDVEEANKYWNTSPYYLNQETHLAKKLGKTYLLNLYEYVDSLLGNRFEDQALSLRLIKLLNFHYQTTATNTI